jgi:hypothetical protein
MRETKLAVLLGHFEKFQILPPKDLGQDAEGHALKRVDVLVKAPYQTMLQWGMQFDDMIMGNEKDLLCTSTFTWKMRQEVCISLPFCVSFPVTPHAGLSQSDSRGNSRAVHCLSA